MSPLCWQLLFFQLNSSGHMAQSTSFFVQGIVMYYKYMDKVIILPMV